MKQLCYMGIVKEGFSGYSSPVMLISRKLTKDNRIVTDFRHLNVRKQKTIWCIFSSDTFSVLGSPKCEVLLVLDLKDAFHILWLSEIQRNIVEYSHILAAHPIYIRESLWDWTFPLLYVNHI